MGRIIKNLGFSLQKSKKHHCCGTPHEDRNAHYESLQSLLALAVQKGIHCLSIDAKNTEKIGKVQRAGKEYRVKGDPRLTLDHDFSGFAKDPDLEEVSYIIPFGIYDTNLNKAHIAFGTSKATSEFSYDSLKYCFDNKVFPEIEEPGVVVITCDCGGGNSNRSNLWKSCVQKLAEETKLCIIVVHSTPYTSKYNKIEHEVFNWIILQWSGEPLSSVFNAIRRAEAVSSKEITTSLNLEKYEKQHLTQEDISCLNSKILRSSWPGEWTYAFIPEQASLKAIELTKSLM